MPTAAKTKASMAGAKRKAETIKGGPSKGSKKPKIDSMQSPNLRVEVNATMPKKTDAVARRLIAGALGVPVPKKNENQVASKSNGENGAITGEAKATRTKRSTTEVLKEQAQADSSDDDFDGSDEDGGVALEGSEDTDELDELDESEDAPQRGQQGVHPDRLKANANGAGQNGMIIHLVLYAYPKQVYRNIIQRGSCKAKAADS
jgi:hypothetical protein